MLDKVTSLVRVFIDDTVAKDAFVTVGSGTTTCWLSPIRTSTESPTLRYALSISENNVKTEEFISSTLNLGLVLYIQELANICL